MSEKQFLRKQARLTKKNKSCTHLHAYLCLQCLQVSNCRGPTGAHDLCMCVLMCVLMVSEGKKRRKCRKTASESECSGKGAISRVKKKERKERNRKQARDSPCVRQVPSHLDTLLPPPSFSFSSPSPLCRLVRFSWRTHFTFQCVTPARHNTC